MTVHSIDGYEITDKRNVNKDMVRGLETLLKDAQAGEIVGIVGAVQYTDSSTGTISCGYRKISPIIGTLQRQIINMARD